MRLDGSRSFSDLLAKARTSPHLTMLVNLCIKRMENAATLGWEALYESWRADLERTLDKVDALGFVPPEIKGGLPKLRRV